MWRNSEGRKAFEERIDFRSERSMNRFNLHVEVGMADAETADSLLQFVRRDLGGIVLQHGGSGGRSDQLIEDSEDKERRKRLRLKL